MKPKPDVMKTIITLSVGIIFWVNGFSQSPMWQWARSVGGPSSESGQCIAVGTYGSLYMAGNFNSASLTFGTTTLYNSGINNLLIAYYDTSGNWYWAKSAGGIDADAVFGIAADNNGNCSITGYYFSPSIQFGSFTLINSPSNENIFVAKYGEGGDVLWAKGIGGMGHEHGRSIATDVSGNVYVTGFFQTSPISFDSITLNNFGGNAFDVFIVKYDDLGNVLWAKSAGGANSDYGYGIAANASGDVFVTGFFASPTIAFGSTTLANAGGVNIFIVKYDSTGNIVWAKSAGVNDAVSSEGIAADGIGNVNIMGEFYSPSVNFGSSTLTNLGNNGTPDIFVTKYDASGNVLWATSAGSTDYDYVTSIATDYNGNCYITGYYCGPTITFGSITLTNAGYRNFFIAKYDSSGNLEWVKNAGGVSEDYGWGIAVDNNSNCYITGRFRSPTITLDSISLTNTNGIYYDIFVAKLGSTPVGINDAGKNNSGIFLSPNPATNEITIHPDFYRDKVQSIEIYNVTGQLQISHFKPQTNSIDVSELTPGIYFVTLTDQTGNKAVRKVVKM